MPGMHEEALGTSFAVLPLPMLPWFSKTFATAGTGMLGTTRRAPPPAYNTGEEWVWPEVIRVIVVDLLIQTDHVK